MCLQAHGKGALDLDLRTRVKCLFTLALLWTAVKAETLWVVQPSDLTVTQGGNVTMPCEVRSDQTVNTIWNKGSITQFFNGQPSSASVPSNYQVDYTSLGKNNLHITNVQLADESFYACQVIGFDSVQVKLTVNIPPGQPSITLNTSLPSVENAVISLTCSSAGGKPTPTIQWLRNGQPVNSAVTNPPAQGKGTTSSRLTVTLTRYDHSANYSCVVFNEANQNKPLITSRILQVQYSPSVSFLPDYSPYHVKLNTQVSITCNVTSFPLYNSLMWYKDNVPLTVSMNILQFPSVEKHDQAKYTCVARNLVAGQTREANASVYLDVLYPPVVTTPNVVTANESEQVNLSCKVEANPPPSEIRWEKVGGSTPHLGPNYIIGGDRQHAGNYSCTAKNRLVPSDGPAEDVSTKRFTTLRIRYKPGRASISPVSSVIVGQTITLNCDIDDPGYPPPTYEWWRMENPGTILQADESSRFTIPTARLDHNGNYTCQPQNMMGVGRADTISLAVNSPPVFLQSTPSTESYTVPITQSNMFVEHKISGRPLPAVHWLKDGQPLSSMSGLYKVETTNTLNQYLYTVSTKVRFIGTDRAENRLRRDDIGNYSCVVSSSATLGQQSKNMHLSVEFEPEITAGDRVAADMGEKARLNCVAQANPTPTIVWYRNGQVLPNTSQLLQEQRPAANVATYEGYLSIASVTNADFGQYQCDVTNNKGQARKNITLSRKGKPEAPGGLNALAKTWESVHLQWTPGFNGGLTQGFFVALQSIYGNKTVEVYPQGVTRFNVTRLMPQTSYTFSVYGSNTLGKGANSATFTAQTEVLVFPALNKVPEFEMEDKKLTVANDLNQSYCLRVEVSHDNGKAWTVIEPCVTAETGEITMDRPGATNVNVSICLVYRPEVCGEPVSSKINAANTPDLTKTQVIIIGCVCAAILTVLLIILIVIICRRRQKNKNYTGDPHSPRTVQQGNGAVPHQKPHSYENTGMTSLGMAYDSRSNQGTLTRPTNNNSSSAHTNNFSANISYGGLTFNSRSGNFPISYHNPAENYPYGDTSYDSHTLDKYEYEMNRRNANISGNGDPYYSDKQGDLSFNGSPRTPTKDGQQFISIPEDPMKEGGSFGSGNESGYSTPDKAKQPKKLRVFPFHVRNPFRREKEEIEPVQYSHDPPGHTCGLPCCNKDLQVRLLKQKQARSCIGIQENDALSQNFTFKGRLRRQAPLEHGFITVQEQKQEERPKIPDFEDDSEKMATLKLPNEKPQSDKTNYHFLKGRAMTLPQGSEPNATEKLYLEDFNFGESGDFLDADGTSNDSEIEYYITVKNPLDADRGVPYNPKDLESNQIYPWDLLHDAKYVSAKAPSEKVSETCSSNYYDVLRIPEDQDNAEKGEKEKDQTDVGETNKTNVKRKQIHIGVPLPPIPPEIPVQNLLNHPPLPKPDANKSATLPQQPNGSLDGLLKDDWSESISSSAKYNTYNSVYSVTNMAHKHSKEAIERYLGKDKFASKSQRPDVTQYDFTGIKTYLVKRKMHESYDKLETKHKTTNEPMDKLETGPVNDCKETLVSKSKSSIVSERIKEHFREQAQKRRAERISEGDEMKEKLLGESLDETETDSEEGEESGGMINKSFKNVNVDGKVVGSRYSFHGMDSGNDELSEIMEHISGLQTNEKTCGEGKDELVNILKQRLITSEFEEEVEFKSSSDLPVTLIL